MKAYVCADCRQDVGVETRARLDALKSRPPIPAGKEMRVVTVGHPAPRGAGERDRAYQARVAEHARVRPLALVAMGGVLDIETAAPACIFGGLHESADVLVECPVPGAARAKRTGRGAGLCAHARQVENCIVCVTTANPLQLVRGGQVDRAGSDRPVSSLRGRRLHPAFRNARSFRMPVSRPGRPAKHGTDAARQKAYRHREKAAQAAANDDALHTSDCGGPNGIWSTDVFPALCFEGQSMTL